MKKTNKLSSIRGIYFPLALLACCVPAAQVNAFQTDAKAVESEKAGPEESAKAKPSKAADEETATDEETKSVKEQIQDLSDELKTATSEWRESYLAAETRAEKTALVRNRPSTSFANKFLAIYSENADDKDAQEAGAQALRLGDPRTKLEVSELIQDAAENQDAETARRSYMLLATMGSRSAKTSAARKLIALTKDEQDDAAALEVLTPLATAMRRNPSIVKDAVEQIWERIKDKPESADLATLLIVGFNSDEDTSSTAFKLILENHLDDENLTKTLSNIPARPTPGFELLVKEIAKNGEGDAQAAATVSLVKYIKVRDRRLDRSKLSEEKLAALDKENEEVIELLKTFDGDSPSHKKAQDELFILTKLVPGAEAMDIVGTDLEGEELKLSDYRGKVVFLDFWGDW